QIFAYCAADPDCHQAYPNPREDLEKIFQRLAQGPVTFEALNPLIGQPQQITLTRPVFNELVRTMLYTPDTFRWLPLVLHQAAAGDFSIFASISYQSFRGIEDQIARGMHFSVVCGEDLPFINDADVARETGESFYGDQRLQAYRKVCAFWPRAQVPTAFATPVKASAPVLLISGEADPVAPPWLAADAAKQLPNGRHLVIPHTGHFFGYPCVDKLVTEFVNKGDAKNLDASCVAEVKAPPFVTGEMLAAMAGGNRNDEKKPAGEEEIWSGVLSAGGQNLRLILHLFKASDGKLTANLDSPDQGDVKGLPIDVVTLKDSALHFEMHLLSATFEGKLNSDGTEISGEWRQSGLSLPLVFKRTAK
ncbi:MAG: alpha/beta hydrolase, partial [Blastocatellia bacterium]|nr:alpha/beta hydrolase [Blastocatellia bacterium]